MKNRKKPGASASFAGTGERPISIQGEVKLDKAIAESTQEREQRIRVLEQENARLQVQISQRQDEIKELVEFAKEGAEEQRNEINKKNAEIKRLQKELKKKNAERSNSSE